MSGDNVIQTPVKSPNDNKEYRIIQLENGLRAILVSDLSSNHGVEDNVDGNSDEESDKEIDEDEENGRSKSDESKHKEKLVGLEIVIDVSSFDENQQFFAVAVLCIALECFFDPDDILGFENVMILAWLILNVRDELSRYLSKRYEHIRRYRNAAASLCVGVGSFSDPDDIPGLAHLLEHMLTMGSEKYPIENEFHAFISQHGGRKNAATKYERTRFYFDVLSKHFRSALDHFAQCFVCPLLNLDSLEREMEAVDSEFRMVLTDDYSRKEQVIKSLAKDGSPLKRFKWGNLETFKTKPLELNIDLHSRLKEFYHRYYSAHYMTLAVQSPETLDTLESWVREIFSQIPSNNLPAPNFDNFSDSFDTPAFYKLYKIIPVNAFYELELTWSLPSVAKYYRIKPLWYLSCLLKLESKGSVFSHLKSKDWARNFSCKHNENRQNSACTMFSVVIELTFNGMSHVCEVITVIFQYIEMLRSIGPQERIFRNIQMNAHKEFRWCEEMSSANYVKMLCENMQLYPDEDIITGYQLIFDFDSEVIANIQNMLVPEKCNISIMWHLCDEEKSKKMFERWFQTPYFVQDIDPEWLAKWKRLEVNPHLHLPCVNKISENNFEIKDPDLPYTEHPVKILDNDQSRLWYKKDNKFKIPKAHVYFRLVSPICNISPQNAVLLDLFNSILRRNLSQTACSGLSTAQLESLICSDDSSVVIQMEGFSDELPILFETVLDYFDNFAIEDELFERARSTLRGFYYNKLLEPKELCEDIRLSILQLTYWTLGDKRSVANETTLEMLLNFVKNFKSKLFIEGLVQGNMTGKEALQMVELVQSKLKCSHIPQNQIPDVRVMQLYAGTKHYHIRGFHVEDENSVVTNYYQLERRHFHESCLSELLITWMEEPCYDTLRTQQQLGYDVHCRLHNTSSILGFSITVKTQATKFSCWEVDGRIEAFLRDFRIKLENKITEKEFQAQVTSLIRLKRCAILRLGQEAAINWSEIITGDYLFDRSNLEAAHLSSITLTEFREWVKEQFRRKNRRKLSVQVVGAGVIVEDNSWCITNIHSFKKSLMTFPVTKIKW